ncbi:type IV secretion system protein VirB3 [Agrobacterium tumefaciens]|uniref:type IV secretion system protein VirB3 n=1 Tax=Agrobacterium tumefaciens TaxID=358 RepID=UPI0015717EC6|nr:VirB3 family type IV secretion system protein [Agrobacterium tumefaciens]NTE37656.1 hypothetical protein [Agrobacterium tumefaciens]NTE53168.1 hypothetical protein [Agrobacterium tumefaciens]
MVDDEPLTETVTRPLTKPLTKAGVRYEVFAINGMVAMCLFIASNSFFLGIGAFVIAHSLSLYFCQREPFIFHILERRMQMRSATKNLSFWGARSYSP